MCFTTVDIACRHACRPSRLAVSMYNDFACSIVGTICAPCTKSGVSTEFTVCARRVLFAFVDTTWRLPHGSADLQHRWFSAPAQRKHAGPQSTHALPISICKIYRSSSQSIQHTPLFPVTYIVLRPRPFPPHPLVKTVAIKVSASVHHTNTSVYHHLPYAISTHAMSQ